MMRTKDFNNNFSISIPLSIKSIEKVYVKESSERSKWLTCFGKFLVEFGFTIAPWSTIRYARCFLLCVSTITSVSEVATL